MTVENYLDCLIDMVRLILIVGRPFSRQEWFEQGNLDCIKLEKVSLSVAGKHSLLSSDHR